MHYDRLTDAMKPLKRGPFGLLTKGLFLEDHVFEKTVFEYVQHGPPNGQKYILRNVTFDRCTTNAGPFWLTSGWELEGVTIDKMKAWRIMINAQAILRNVTITSYAKAGRLEILPDISTEKLPSRQFDTPGYELDISGYKGDLRIMGINAATVKVDKSRQYRLRLPDSKFRAADLDGLNARSLLGIGLDQMSAWRVRDAIFSLPPPKDKYFEQEQKALEAAYRAGIAF